MNINRKKTFVKLDGKRYAMVLDFESAIYFQEQTGKSIFEGINNIGQSQDMLSLAYLVGATLRDKEDNLVGVEVVKKLDIINNLETLMGAMTELMDNSVQKESKAKAVKKK
ncbi:hypothetical protein UT300003_31890 [Clostridium sardiniense]